MESDIVQNMFDGRLEPISIDNELAAWNVIDKTCDKGLRRFSTTLQQDTQILKQDDEEHTLSFNKRNCILFRKGEKEIFHFYKECNVKINKLLNMPLQKAHSEISTWTDQDDSIPYFSTHYFY